MINFKCSICKEPLEAPDSMAGQSIQCPKCGSLEEISYIDYEEIKEEINCNSNSIKYIKPIEPSKYIKRIQSYPLSKPKKSYKNTIIAICCIFMICGTFCFYRVLFYDSGKNRKSSDAKIKNYHTSNPIYQSSNTIKMPQEKSFKNKPIFGIYLGESISSLQKRMPVELLYSEKEIPKDCYTIDIFNGYIGIIYISTYNNYIYSIRICFQDTSYTNYNALKDEIENKYGVKTGDDYDLKENLLGETSYDVIIEGKEVHISINRDEVLEKKLDISYYYTDVLLGTVEQEKNIKANRLKDDI